ncbi:hypothetical protein C1I95_24280 [Micromonospora craterilacus]|uniref:Uncharacterized protein n=1 Tax=Micromonospora craterilacus TaxID=1655439 RepID=A0A2W2E7G2_9ACTN|nr:hypothetical protein C1I95_24280 [Micromonospora craterilacus]
MLLCDTDDTAGRLYQELTQNPLVRRLRVAGSLDEAARRTVDGEFDVVVVDPLSIGLAGLAGAGEFALARADAGMAVVLYVDLAEVESRASVFYYGERARLKDLFILDRRIPPAVLAAEANEVLIKCQALRLLATGRVRADRLLDEVRDIAVSTGDGELEQLVEEVGESRILERVRPDAELVRPTTAGTVFLSHRADEADGYVRGLTELLEDKGFTVLTGRGADGYVGTAVLNRIRDCEFFVSLMTRDRPLAGDGERYATSAWLVEEKGAALAFRKYMVLLVEEGVDDIGRLQGDWQRHRFTPTTFTTAARAAVAQLGRHSGRSEAA